MKHFFFNALRNLFMACVLAITSSSLLLAMETGRHLQIVRPKKSDQPQPPAQAEQKASTPVTNTPKDPQKKRSLEELQAMYFPIPRLIAHNKIEKAINLYFQASHSYIHNLVNVLDYDELYRTMRKAREAFVNETSLNPQKKIQSAQEEKELLCLAGLCIGEIYIFRNLNKLPSAELKKFINLFLLKAEVYVNGTKQLSNQSYKRRLALAYRFIAQIEKDKERSLAFIRFACRLRPNNENLSYHLGEILLTHDPVSDTDIDEGFKLFNSLLDKLSPSDPIYNQILFTLGYLYDPQTQQLTRFPKEEEMALRYLNQAQQAGNQDAITYLAHRVPSTQPASSATATTTEEPQTPLSAQQQQAETTSSTPQQTDQSLIPTTSATQPAPWATATTTTTMEDPEKPEKKQEAGSLPSAEQLRQQIASLNAQLTANRLLLNEGDKALKSTIKKLNEDLEKQKAQAAFQLRQIEMQSQYVPGAPQYFPQPWLLVYQQPSFMIRWMPLVQPTQITATEEAPSTSSQAASSSVSTQRQSHEAPTIYQEFPHEQWLEGIKLLKNKETFDSGITLFEQLIPIEGEKFDFRISPAKEDLQHLSQLIHKKPHLQDNPVARSLFIRIWLDSDHNVIKFFTANHVNIFFEKSFENIPLEKKASIHLIKGLILYRGIYHQPSLEEAVNELSYVVIHPSPQHIRKEALALLHSIICSTLKQDEQCLKQANSLYGVMKAMYLLIPNLIAQNNINRAIELYFTAEKFFYRRFHFLPLKNDPSDTSLYNIMFLAQKALINETSLNKQKITPVEPEKELMCLMALCYGETKKLLKSQPKSSRLPSLQELIECFFEKAEPYISEQKPLTNPLYREWLSNTYDIIAHFMFQKKADKSRVLPFIRTACKLNPTSSKINYHLGRILLMLPPVTDEEEREGMSLLTKRLEIGGLSDPTYGTVAQNLGVIYDPEHPEIQLHSYPKDEQRAQSYYELANEVKTLSALPQQQEQEAETPSIVPEETDQSLIPTPPATQPATSSSTTTTTTTETSPKIEEPQTTLSALPQQQQEAETTSTSTPQQTIPATSSTATTTTETSPKAKEPQTTVSALSQQQQEVETASTSAPQQTIPSTSSTATTTTTTETNPKAEEPQSAPALIEKTVSKVNKQTHQRSEQKKETQKTQPQATNQGHRTTKRTIPLPTATAHHIVFTHTQLNQQPAPQVDKTIQQEQTAQKQEDQRTSFQTQPSQPASSASIKQQNVDGTYFWGDPRPQIVQPATKPQTQPQLNLKRATYADALTPQIPEPIAQGSMQSVEQQQENLRAKWLRGIAALKQKETLLEGIHLLEQIIPLNKQPEDYKDYSKIISKEEIADIIRTLSTTEDPDVLAFIVRICIIFDRPNKKEKIEELLKIVDDTRQTASFRLIKGYILYHGISSTKSQAAKSLLISVAMDEKAPNHIRKEAHLHLQENKITFVVV